jgi:hypothetical protein
MIMEEIQRALSRQQQSRDRAEAFEAPEIRTVNDIRRVLAILDPGIRTNKLDDKVLISTEMIGSDGRKPSNFRVETTTSSKSYRQILVDGFQVIQQRLDTMEKLSTREKSLVEVNGKPMIPPPVVNCDGRLAMDSIIERLLGGYRSGRHVCWDLADGYTYKYEIFQHRLTKVKKGSDES